MTKLTDPTQTFWRPEFQAQGPATNCVIDGHALGWDSCTMYAGAMALDATSGGKMQPSGCALRRASGDTSGGTTLWQMAYSVNKLYGVQVDVRTGSNVLTPARVAAEVRAGHKVVVQGNADAMIGKPQQSTAGPVNHAVMVNEVRGGTVSEPAEALVYDPAADGRKRTYHVDQGPTWWPWSLVKTFCANLRPMGNGTPRLGPGKVYVGVFPDSEPHVSLRTGAVKSSPFPDRTRTIVANVRVHSVPSSSDATVIYTIPKVNTLVVGYQYAEGSLSQGSRTWLGNDDGTEWVHVKRLSHVGGAT